jgi:UDP-N-acetyl-D-glucosamine dehydrogenase
MRSVADLLAAARQADCVVVVTDHSGVDYPELVRASRLIFDTRNAVGVSDPKVVRL